MSIISKTVLLSTLIITAAFARSIKLETTIQPELLLHFEAGEPVQFSVSSSFGELSINGMSLNGMSLNGMSSPEPIWTTLP